jgi:hypothetical protein
MRHLGIGHLDAREMGNAPHGRRIDGHRFSVLLSFERL